MAYVVCIEKKAEFTDILFIHPYYYLCDDDLRLLSSEGFDWRLERYKGKKRC